MDESRGSYTGVQALPVLPQHFHIVPFSLYSRHMDNPILSTRKSSGTTPASAWRKMICWSPALRTKRNSSSYYLFFWPKSYLGSEKIRANRLEGVEAQDKQGTERALGCGKITLGLQSLVSNS